MASDAGALVTAVDDKVMPFGFAPDGFIDRGGDSGIVWARPQ
jgi:hypothetical protein